jgi:polycomb protein EED
MSIYVFLKRFYVNKRKTHVNFKHYVNVFSVLYILGKYTDRDTDMGRDTGSERERETDRDRETDRETDKETDMDTDRDRDKDSDRYTDNLNVENYTTNVLTKKVYQQDQCHNVFIKHVANHDR